MYYSGFGGLSRLEKRVGQKQTNSQQQNRNICQFFNVIKKNIFEIYNDEEFRLETL